MNVLVINTPILGNVITLIKIIRNVFLVKIKAIHQEALSGKASIMKEQKKSTQCCLFMPTKRETFKFNMKAI